MVRQDAQTSHNRLNFYLLLILTLAVSCLLIVNCASKRITRKENKALEDLGVTAEKFNKYLEWQHYDAALPYVAAEYRSAFMAGTDMMAGTVQIEQVQFLFAEMAPFEPDPNLDKGDNNKLRISLQGRQARVSVRYVNVSVLPSNKVFTYRDMQYWEYRGESWKLLPDLGWILGEEAWNQCLSQTSEPPPKPKQPTTPFTPPPLPTFHPTPTPEGR